MRYSDGVNGFVTLLRIRQGSANDRNNGAEMLTRGKLRYNSAERLMSGDLRSYYVRDDLLTRAHDSRCRLVARALNA